MIRKKKILTSFLSLFLLYHCVFAGNSINLKQISIEQNLPGVSIQSLFQDSYGLMWFGIESVGLCKFDGQEYTVYETIPGDTTSISNNFPISIVEDSKGALWVATTGGLNKFDRNKGTFKRYLHQKNNSNSIPDDYVLNITLDKHGYLWVGTANGLVKYNPNKDEFLPVLVNEVNDTELPYISFIDEDNEGNIWVGSWQRGLVRITARSNLLNSKEWNSKNANQLENKLIYDKEFFVNKDSNGKKIFKDVRTGIDGNNGNYYIGTASGVYLYNKFDDSLNKMSFSSTKDSVINNSIISKLLIDANNNLWICTTNNGMGIYNLTTKKIEYFNADKQKINGLRSNSVRDIIEDNSGLIWIATKFQGIHLYDPRQTVFNIVNKSNHHNLSHNFILSITEDNQKNIWVGTKIGGLNKFSKKYGITNTYMNIPGKNTSLKSNRIEMIMPEGDRFLWLATETSLEKFDKKNETFKHYGDIHIKCILAVGDQYIWLGTNMNGLFVFDKTSGKIERHKSKHNNLFLNNHFQITLMKKDEEGNIWIGTRNNGLYKYTYSNDSLNHYYKQENDNKTISGNMIRSFFQNKDGQIWIGTKSDGINIIDSNNITFTKISELNGLPSSTIYSIMDDEEGNFWFGTHNGISKYNKTENKFENFNESYGLQGKVYEINAFCKASDGTMYLGGSNGFNYFDPLTTKKKTFIAPIIISSLKIFDKPLVLDINKDTNIVISYKDRYISFNYALLDYSSPNNNQYAYMLEHFDTDWQYCGNRHFTSYSSLAPGKYTFYVKGANMDNYWNENGVKVGITILAPFWKKSWFFLVLIITISLLISGIYKLRMKAVRRNEKYLTKVVKQKTGDLQKANEALERGKHELEKNYKVLMDQSEKITTQNEELEKHRSQLENLVSDRTKDLEIAKRKAEDSDRLKSAFLANMSHEIRTPLNAIVGFSDLISNEDYDANELHRIHSMIKTNSQSLLQLINDIIDISKIEANQIVINDEPFNLNLILTTLYNNYKSQLEIHCHEKDLQIVTELEKNSQFNDLIIEGDAFRIEQVYNNLFSNAMKFTKSGKIRMGYEADFNNNMLTFFMSDTGVGIAPQNHNVVFDRFRKIEDSKEKIYRGTGLGLSISANLVNLMGGKMWVESRVNEGATFYFNLPLKTSNNVSDLFKKEYVKESKIPDWSEKSLLIVEDEESNVDVLKTMLKKTNINITVVNDGIEAVDICVNDKRYFDVILMDIKMPRMNGKDATKKIIENGVKTPIIAQTAYAMHDEQIEIMKIGFKAYLAKPILSRELISKISQFI